MVIVMLSMWAGHERLSQLDCWPPNDSLESRFAQLVLNACYLKLILEPGAASRIAFLAVQFQTGPFWATILAQGDTSERAAHRRGKAQPDYTAH